MRKENQTSIELSNYSLSQFRKYFHKSNENINDELELSRLGNLALSRLS